MSADRGEKGERGERGYNGAPGLKGDPGNDHICSQAVTLNTICLKLENIEVCIEKMEKKQDTYLQEIRDIRERDAQYPSPEEAKAAIDMAKNHDTYIKMAGTGLILLWGLVVAIGMKLWGASAK